MRQGAPRRHWHRTLMHPQHCTGTRRRWRQPLQHCTARHHRTLRELGAQWRHRDGPRTDWRRTCWMRHQLPVLEKGTQSKGQGRHTGMVELYTAV